MDIGNSDKEIEDQDTEGWSSVRAVAMDMEEGICKARPWVGGESAIDESSRSHLGPSRISARNGKGTTRRLTQERRSVVGVDFLGGTKMGTMNTRTTKTTREVLVRMGLMTCISPRHVDHAHPCAKNSGVASRFLNRADSCSSNPNIEPSTALNEDIEHNGVLAKCEGYSRIRRSRKCSHA